MLIAKNYFVIMKFLTNIKSMPVLLHHVDAIVDKKMIFIQCGDLTLESNIQVSLYTGK